MDESDRKFATVLTGLAPYGVQSRAARDSIEEEFLGAMMKIYKDLKWDPTQRTVQYVYYASEYIHEQLKKKLVENGYSVKDIGTSSARNIVISGWIKEESELDGVYR